MHLPCILIIFNSGRTCRQYSNVFQGFCLCTTCSLPRHVKAWAGYTHIDQGAASEQMCQCKQNRIPEKYNRKSMCSVSLLLCHSGASPAQTSMHQTQLNIKTCNLLQPISCGGQSPNAACKRKTCCSRSEEGHPAAAIRARRKGESSWILLIPEARPDPYKNLHTLWT